MFRTSQLTPQIVREWMKRSPGHRTESDVRPFYAQLAELRPKLLDFGTSGDKYYRLLAILRHHIEHR